MFGRVDPPDAPPPPAASAGGAAEAASAGPVSTGSSSSELCVVVGVQLAVPADDLGGRRVECDLDAVVGALRQYRGRGALPAAPRGTEEVRGIEAQAARVPKRRQDGVEVRQNCAMNRAENCARQTAGRRRRSGAPSGAAPRQRVPRHPHLRVAAESEREGRRAALSPPGGRAAAERPRRQRRRRAARRRRTCLPHWRRRRRGGGGSGGRGGGGGPGGPAAAAVAVVLTFIHPQPAFAQLPLAEGALNNVSSLRALHAARRTRSAPRAPPQARRARATEAAAALRITTAAQPPPFARAAASSSASTATARAAAERRRRRHRRPRPAAGVRAAAAAAGARPELVRAGTDMDRGAYDARHARSCGA